MVVEETCFLPVLNCCFLLVLFLFSKYCVYNNCAYRSLDYSPAWKWLCIHCMNTYWNWKRQIWYLILVFLYWLKFHVVWQENRGFGQSFDYTYQWNPAYYIHIIIFNRFQKEFASMPSISIAVFILNIWIFVCIRHKFHLRKYCWSHATTNIINAFHYHFAIDFFFHLGIFNSILQLKHKFAITRDNSS